jgi:AcrR family transcriptional regulator
MKDENKDGVKQKIINSSIEIIGKEGIDELTTRKVANNSGVNVAAINYYFGSKDKLITEVLNFFFNNKAPKMFSILENTEYSSEEKLYRFFKTYMNELSKYPGVIKTIVSSLLKGKMEFIDKVLFIKSIVVKLQELIADHTGIKDMNIVTIRMMHTMSAILFPMAMYKFYPKLFDNVTIFDENTRELYMDTLLRNTLNINVENFSKIGERK